MALVNLLLAFFVGMAVGMLIVVLLEVPSTPKREDKPCPHGWEDWNDCPDCCH